MANLKPSTNFDGWYAVWALTRGLLAAGWAYKGSGDATATGTKDTSGVFTADKWGVAGGVNLLATVQTGTSSDTMTANTDGTVTHVITGATFSATLSVGRYLTVTGAVNAKNNGTFRIVAYTSATTVKVFNPASTTETTSVTWSEQHGGATGTISTVSTGAATRTRAIFSVSAGTPFVAPTTSPVNRGSVGDRLTIIGGAVGANNGTYMITRVISTTSVEIDNAGALATGETNNGTLSWVQCSPTQQKQPASITGLVGPGAWICLQGPSTLKIPIGANVPSGAFIRGEKVTQTTSGATGTIVGCMTDTGTSLGHLVIEPRIPGTGGGVRGWTSGATDTVTGAVSGVTVTSANVTTVEFVRELVIWKDFSAQGSFVGHMWAQTVDASSESASRYSVLAAAAGVTNVIAPGGATATFPTAGSYVLYGTGSSNAAGTGGGSPYGVNFGNASGSGSAHILCATCIENTDEGADGSWTALQSTLAFSASGVPDTYAVMSFMRMDGSEDGDLDPYVHFISNGASNYTGSRTANIAVVSITGPGFINAYFMAVNSACLARGWRRRGFASADAWQQYQCASLFHTISTLASISSNIPPIGRVACHPNPNLPIREAIHVISTQSAQKQRKGYMRWWFWTEGGECNRLLFNGSYMQAGGYVSGGSSGGPLVVGPWDGVSIPVCGI